MLPTFRQSPFVLEALSGMGVGQGIESFQKYQKWTKTTILKQPKKPDSRKPQRFIGHR
jgi:hypothetical protein